MIETLPRIFYDQNFLFITASYRRYPSEIIGPEKLKLSKKLAPLCMMGPLKPLEHHHNWYRLQRASRLAANLMKSPRLI